MWRPFHSLGMIPAWWSCWFLKEYIKDLEARLAKYENAHTPPSLKRGCNRKRDQNSRDQGKPGQKIGHNSEVLAERFEGIIVFDGWRSYPKFTNDLQRCWAHLLRESKDLSEKIDEAVPLHNALKELYEELNSKLDCDPPPEVRRELRNTVRAILQYWIQKEYASDKVRKLIGKISNGFKFWFTFILHPGVEPTVVRRL